MNMIADPREHLVVVGNGMAGMRTVEELLKLPNAHRFRITVFGAEPHVNYNRIMLSSVLAGDKELDDIVINSREWYEENHITLVTSDAVTTGATVEHLRTEREQWRQQNRQLEYELAKLQSLAWVENEAVNRLGMQPARPVAFLNVDRPRPASSRSGPASLARRDNAEVNPLLITPSLTDLMTADASTSSGLR